MDCLLNAVYTSTTSISSNPGQSFKYPLVITFKSLSSMNKGVILLFFGVLLVVGSVGVQPGGITLKDVQKDITVTLSHCKKASRGAGNRRRITKKLGFQSIYKREEL